MQKGLTVFIAMMIVFSLNAWEHSHNIYLDGGYNYHHNQSGYKLKLEYYPSFTAGIWENDKYSLDGYMELEGYGEADIFGDKTSGDIALSLYRGWLRATKEQLELRIGLQKINFGPAVYLRSLQWFDVLNPFDPRNQTEGVNAVLFRYYTPGNSNFWLWGLYGESEPKGNEVYGSEEDSFEFGGRMQLAALGGELGISSHHRRINSMVSDDYPWVISTAARETRVGFDGQWDIEIGLWFESSIYINETDSNLSRFTESYTVGTDYTIAAGNGLHLLFEHQHQRTEEDLWVEPDAKNSFSEFAADYPLGIYDKLVATAGYDHINNKGYYYLSYQRVYDYISLYLNGSINPEQDLARDIYLAGSGVTIQLLFQLNY